MLEVTLTGDDLNEERIVSKRDAIQHPVIDYLVLLLLICMSGNPVFDFNGMIRVIWLIAFAVFWTLLYARHSFKMSKRLWLVAIGFGILFCVHGLVFEFFPLQTIVGFYIKILIAYAACCILKDFFRCYIDVFLWICGVSLCFFFSEQLLRLCGLDIRPFFMPISDVLGSSERIHIGIYNFYAINRNSGMFWEPGAFCGYLLIALVFLGLRKKSFSTQEFWIRLTVISVGVLTTFSTAGYIIFPAILPLFWRWDPCKKVVSIVTNILFCVSFLLVEIVFYNVYRIRVDQPSDPYFQSERFEDHIHGDFIFQKMKRQYKYALGNGNIKHRNRFDDVVADWGYIKRRPLMGWGIHKQTRYRLYPDVPYESGHGCGLTDYFSKFGLFGFMILLACLYMSCLRLSGGAYLVAIWSVGLLLLISAGENYNHFPLYYTLLFLGIHFSALKTEKVEKVT